MGFYRITIFSLKLKKNSYKWSVFLKQQDTFADLPTGYCKSTCHVLPPLILDKVKINIVQVMDQFPIGYQLSACPLFETADNPVCNVLFFFVLFFCKRFFCVCFQDSVNTTKPFRL